MTFDPFSYPGPSSSGARFRDPAVGGGRDGRGDRRDRGRQGPAAPGGRWGDARPQAHRDPIAWAYDPFAQEGCDSHSRVDRPRAADYAADPFAGRPDPYDYGSAPRARGPYDYGSDPRVEDFYDDRPDPDYYDDRPDPDYSRRGPRRTRRHRKLRAAAGLFNVLMYARRLESSYYGPGPYGPAPYDYGPDPYGPAPYDYGPGPVPRDPYYGPDPWYPPRYVPYRYALRRKSKVAAGLLGIFLGSFGVHNFYLGYTNKAVGQLVGTIIGFILSFIVIGVFIVIGIEIWALVEGILILCAQPGSQPWGVDARGIPLSS